MAKNKKTPSEPAIIFQSHFVIVFLKKNAYICSLIKRLMKKEFVKISEDERRRALAGERIDHHLTEYESIALGYGGYWADFNKHGGARDYYGLYLRRHDDEMAKFFSSLIEPMPRIPVGGVSDYREVDVYTGP
jgi:hypothetical protein